MFCCIRRSVESSCHKQDSWRVALCCPSPAINKRRRLILQTMTLTNLPQWCGTLFTTPDGRTFDNTRWSEILVENIAILTYPICIPRPQLCTTRCYIHYTWLNDRCPVTGPADSLVEDVSWNIALNEIYSW